MSTFDVGEIEKADSSCTCKRSWANSTCRRSDKIKVDQTSSIVFLSSSTFSVPIMPCQSMPVIASQAPLNDDTTLVMAVL